DHSVVEAGRGGAEPARERRVEARRVVDDHVDPARRTQREPLAERVVGALELVEYLLLEAARAAQSAALVDRDVLVQHEVRRAALLELTVGPARARDRRQRKGE